MANEAAPLAYLDTNVLIAALEGEETIKKPVQNFLRKLSESSGVAAPSELTLAELFSPRGEVRQPLDEELKRDYLDLLLWSGLFMLIPVSRDILLDTAELRSRHPTRLNLPDAIHLASAEKAGCSYFVSSDRGIRPPRTLRDVVRTRRVLQ